MDSYPEIDDLKNQTTDETILFFSDAIGVLVNWSPHGIDIWGEGFPTLEHAYHYKKFVDSDAAAARDILTAKSPYQAMKLAKAHRAKRRPDWDDIKIDVMTELTRQKMLQNSDAREVLLATGDRQLIENSPWDSFWGCGEDGQGQNMAGKILMQIRDELRASAL